MKLSEQGEYTIEQQGNILLVDARGPFSNDVTQKYAQDMHAACERFDCLPWGLLATFYGNSVFTPDAEQALIELTKYRVKRGMIANASVILNSNSADIQQMQLRRIYQTCQLTFHVFADIESAQHWLNEFVAKQRSHPTSAVS